jgi:hypothetical protein
MKNILIIFVLCLFVSCSSNGETKEKELTFEEQIVLDAKSNIKGFSNNNIDSLSLMLFNYPNVKANSISNFIITQTQIDPLRVISNVEYIARNKFGIKSKESKKVFQNTKLILDTLIKQKSPSIYFTGRGTRNSYLAFIDTLDNYNFYWRSAFGVSHYFGKCLLKENKRTFLPNKLSDDFRFCYLKQDTMFQCNSHRYSIINKKSW